jgi:phospholipid-binding lipoprotein MlaA
MRFLIFFFFCICIQVCGAAELPNPRFNFGVDRGPTPDSHCYEYICSGIPFPVPEGNYYFFRDGKLCFAFRDQPGHINVVHELGGRDPLEGFNRTMFSMTHFFMRWVFRPIGTVYCTIMPRPAIKAVNNIADNLNFPKRFLGCIFQAKFYDSGIAFTRFVFNSSVGVGGMWDASEYFLGLYKRDEDFGQVFASWGIGPGCYVFVPGEGPCNLRNALGKIFDYALDIKSYIYGAQATTAFHRMLAQYEDYDTLMTTTADPYEILKNFWLIQRKNMVDDNNLNVQYVGKDEEDELQSAPTKRLSYDDLKYVKMKSYGSQGVEIDTLKALFFDVQKEKKSLWTYLSLFNNDFVNQGSTYSIQLQKDKDPMEYHFWGQPDNPEAPLMLLVPGIGSHYRDSKAMAMAEILHEQGFAVAVISSAFNWHFMETASSVDAPGFLPVDADDTRKAWAKIIPQLKEKDDINPKRIIMIGYSMGALHSLHIAKLEEQQNTLGVDRYLAINPPVNLLYSINQLDKYYNIHNQWSKDELVKRSTVAFGKMMVVAQRRYRFHDEVHPEAPSFYEADHHRLNIE